MDEITLTPSINNNLKKSIISDGFIINKDTRTFFFSISIEKDIIIIKCKEELILDHIYTASFKLKEIKDIHNCFKILNSLEQIFDKIILLFNSKKVEIEIVKENKIEISLLVYDPFEGPTKCPVSLVKQKIKNNLINTELCNQIKYLKQEIIALKENNKSLKEELYKEINELKNQNNYILKLLNSSNGSICTAAPIRTSNTYPPRHIKPKEEKINEKPKENISSKNVSKIQDGKESENEITPIKFIKKKELKLSSISKINNDEKIFCAFKSVDNNFYLIYTNEQYSIIIYNLINNEIKEINSAHMEYISFLKHYIDTRYKNQKDIIISASNLEGKFKIWDASTLECLYSILMKFKGEIKSISFSSNINNFYVYASSMSENEPIKSYNYLGNEDFLKNSNYQTYYLEKYYDTKKNKEYIISCNYPYVTSYDLEKKDLYKSYKDYNRQVKHYFAIIFRHSDIAKLIESDEEGIISIWMFHIGTIMEKIKIGNSPINELLLWNENYILASDPENINIIDLDELKIIPFIEDDKNGRCSIEKIEFEKDEEYLLIQSKLSGGFSLWRCEYTSISDE